MYNLGCCTCSGFRTLFSLLSWLSVLGRKVLCLHCWLKTPCVAVNSKREISLNETPACHSWALSIPETTLYSWPGQNLHGRHNQRKNWNVLMHPCVANEASPQVVLCLSSCAEEATVAPPWEVSPVQFTGAAPLCLHRHILQNFVN